MAPEDGTYADASAPENNQALCCSSATPSCWRTSLTLVSTTVRLLGNTPACHPIGEPSIAIVWFRRRHTPTTLVGATLAMDSAAPLLLTYSPARLPIGEPIVAIVGICWRRRRCRLAITDVVDPAAPFLLALLPGRVLVYCTIVWIDRSGWGWRRHENRSWLHKRWLCEVNRSWLHHRWRRCGSRWGWRWWRRGWPCKDRRWLHNRWRWWRCCGRTAPANGRTTIIFLRLGPHVLGRICSPKARVQHTSLAIEWQRSGQARHEPEQQRDQQQETQKTTTGDHASEISLRTAKIPSLSDVGIRRFLRVTAMATADVGQSASTSTAAASDTARGAILSWTHTTSAATSPGAAS